MWPRELSNLTKLYLIVTSVLPNHSPVPFTLPYTLLPILTLFGFLVCKRIGFGTAPWSSLPALTFWFSGSVSEFRSTIALLFHALWVSIWMCKDGPHLLTTAWFMLQLSVTVSESHYSCRHRVSCIHHTHFVPSPLEQILLGTQQSFKNSLLVVAEYVTLIHNFTQFQGEKKVLLRV